MSHHHCCHLHEIEIHGEAYSTISAQRYTGMYIQGVKFPHIQMQASG